MPTILLLALAAAPNVHKLAAPGLVVANLEPKLAQTLEVHLSQQLAMRGGFAVTTPQEIATLLGLERQRQLLNCNDESSSCVAEIANALGVDAVVLGALSRVGSAFLLNLKVVDAHTGATLALYSDKPTTEDAVVASLEAAAVTFGAQLRPPAASGSLARPLAWTAAGLSVASLATGAVFLGLAHGTETALRAGDVPSPATMDKLQGLAATGRTQETVGAVLLGVGAAAAAASVGLFLVPAEVTVAVAPLPGGAVATVGGHF